MKYEGIYKGEFVSRPNRFIANVIIDGRLETVHVKNTGRCRELLVPGAAVYLQRHHNTRRKTKWSLISVEKGGRMVNIDSQAPNKAVFEWLSKGGLPFDITTIKPEFVYGRSRMDFLITAGDDRILIEVKGVTLENDGVAMFPDAPTDRGVRHLLELCDSLEDSFMAAVIFVIQMEGVKYFTPNVQTHKEFAEALSYVRKKGVRVLAFDCCIGADYMHINKEVQVVL
ncbi:MAG: DNA/RNA nuclease SfsA [Clostridiaceae bacterium]|nr:DNA/RNA nuclease SfsA [Clostridiaceae bacterium]